MHIGMSVTPVKKKKTREKTLYGSLCLKHSNSSIFMSWGDNQLFSIPKLCEGTVARVFGVCVCGGGVCS